MGRYRLLTFPHSVFPEIPLTLAAGLPDCRPMLHESFSAAEGLKPPPPRIRPWHLILFNFPPFLFPETPLTLAAGLPDCRPLLMALIGGGAHPDYRNVKGQTVMHRAAMLSSQANM